jgi:hypothetical protein
VVQTTQYSTGAANAAAPNLTKMLTLCHFFPCACTNTIGATNTVPPKQWHNYCIALVGCKEKGSVSSAITNHRIMPNNLAGNEQKRQYVFFFKIGDQNNNKKTFITMVHGIYFSFATFLTPPYFSLVTALRYAMGH